MSKGISTVIFPVKDLAQAKALYGRLLDVEQTVKALVEAGAQLRGEVRDVGGGKLIATVIDPDGNPIGLSQPPAAQ